MLLHLVEVDGANFEPSIPHNLVVYGYIVHMYVYLDRLFSWSSNTLVKLSMPAWPTFIWVMNDSKPIFQSEIKMLSQHGYNMAAWLWKNIRNADRGLIYRGVIHRRCLHFFQIFWPTPAHVGKFQELYKHVCYFICSRIYLACVVVSLECLYFNLEPICRLKNPTDFFFLFSEPSDKIIP